MDVEIEGQQIRLDQRQVLGAGGEGTVFLAEVAGQRLAVKVYHQPTPARQEKLRAFLARPWSLPTSRVALPLQSVHASTSGEIIGLTMPYIGAGFEALARLANKHQRATSLLTAREVAAIFLDGAATLEAIHRNGLIVGDFNDQNALYREKQFLWIDVDAWQFADYPCPVATEDFVAPELYGIDLGLRPVFEPTHDWYTYAVHLFRSLLLAHPYGGTHAGYPSLIKRAQQRIFILAPAVIYPKIAYTPELLSDELSQVFERIFAQGWRGPFPRAVLQRYYDELVTCATCGGVYPHERAQCPLCQARTTLLLQQPRSSAPGRGPGLTELLRTPGKFVFTQARGETVYAVAYEGGNAVLYSATPGQVNRRVELFKELPGARYALHGTTLIVNPPQSALLLCLEISGPQPVALCQFETALFAGTRQAIFQANEQHVLALVNKALIYGTPQAGDQALSGRVLRSVMEDQTWFAASPYPTLEGLPVTLGYFQVLRQQFFWYQRGHASYELALAPLEDAEAQLDLAIYFSEQGALIRRLTHEHGVDYLRTELIDARGRVTNSTPRIRRTAHPSPHLHGLAYASEMLLHASDDGIVQERVAQRTFKTFSATRDYVREGDALTVYRSGLLVSSEEHVSYLVL